MLASAWPMFGSDPQMDDRVTVSGPAYPVYREVWTGNLSESWDLGGFVVDDGSSIYLGTLLGSLDAGFANRVLRLSAQGSQVWSRTIGSGGYCGWSVLSQDGK